MADVTTHISKIRVLSIDGEISLGWKFGVYRALFCDICWNGYKE